ncbi:MAG: SEL1-like repeat protein [Alphaproteobacteria bacterium]|nr:SEL1-like repeat protein [Alphaproteobacteria bacterium]
MTGTSPPPDASPAALLLQRLDPETRRLVEAAAATAALDPAGWLDRRVVQAAGDAGPVEIEAAPAATPAATPPPRRTARPGRRFDTAPVAAALARAGAHGRRAAEAGVVRARRVTDAGRAAIAQARRRWGDRRLVIAGGGVAGFAVLLLIWLLWPPPPDSTGSVVASVTLPATPAAPAPVAPATAPAPAASAAADALRQRAERGDAMAAHDLGVLYADGRSVTRDYVLAARWFRQAANGGVANAQFNLAVLLERGLGLGENAIEAARLYRAAAEQGHAGAQYNLGIVLAEGRGVTQDYADAAAWFRRAADQGFAKAAYNLGVLHERGFLGTVDDVEAYRWYARALESGDGDAKERMELIARRLTPQDLVLARQRPTGSVDPAVVAEVQRLLTARGYRPGTPDGAFGERTADAIRRFQRDQGLPEDGQPTAELLQRLGGSIPGQ